MRRSWPSRRFPIISTGDCTAPVRDARRDSAMEAHPPPACLSVRDGRLYMDGLHLTSLTRRFGSPLFVFSRQQVEASIKSLLSLNGPDDPPVQVHYACKANSNLGLLRVIRAASLNLEVNSGGELWKGRQAGFTGSQILFNGVAKT